MEYRIEKGVPPKVSNSKYREIIELLRDGQVLSVSADEWSANQLHAVRANALKMYNFRVFTKRVGDRCYIGRADA